MVPSVRVPSGVHGRPHVRSLRRRYQDPKVLKNSSNSWIIKYYDKLGSQRTHTLGRAIGPDRITETEAKRRKAEFMQRLNAEITGDVSVAARRDRSKATIREFVEGIYYPMRTDPAAVTVRANTFANQRQRIKAYVLPVIGDLDFRRVDQSDLVRVLKAARDRNLGESMLRKIRIDLIQVFEFAHGNEYISRNITTGLPVIKPMAQAAEKRTLSLADYAAVWKALEERDRLAFDLVMIVGLRESEAYGLQCGDLIPGGIEIQRSWYKGKIEATKTSKSRRRVGLTGPLRERLEAHIASLPANRETDWVFPSAAIKTPELPGNAMANRIKPRLEPLGYRWVNFAILRRSLATRNLAKKRDVELTAYQQGHSVKTHLGEYVTGFELKTLARGPAQDYDELMECLGAK